MSTLEDFIARIEETCGEEKSAQGMARHIAAIHKVPGVSLEDLNRIKQGEITPPDLVNEKGEAVANLSPEIDKKYFSDWNDIEEDPEDPEGLGDPEEIPKKEDLEDS